MFTTRGHVPVSGPSRLLARVCAHLADHGVSVALANDAAQIVLGAAHGCVRVAGVGLEAMVSAPDLGALRALRAAIASHVLEFAPPGVEVVMTWEGDGAGEAPPPDFRLLTVMGTQTLTPHMRRIHFHGEDLGHFDTLDALHVRLFIPPPGVAAPAWPLMDVNGRLVEQPADRRPAIRKYTIRSIDTGAGDLAIDFVLHDDAGPGAAFAATARPGDVIGVAGPGGRGLRQAERYVFLTDETGLPAVARMLEALPDDASGLVMAEVADTAGRQPLKAPAGVTVTWLYRGGQNASRLADAFETLAWPEDGPGVYLWAACEHAAARLIRASARARLRSGRDQHLIVSYWRNGMAEEQHASHKLQEQKGAAAADPAPV
ncbi:hypothetical protein GCM10019059_27240 [Camelimonas fluminis]|uniref:DUF2218 domain-containing protein n=1 Tax=Camelimonas fluminis TaxID=1576911 RepID=A0ABV7UE34_9HYPH|nr:siderophore-interacting protein [Camelimonas fluminis]GHE66093.1 hypothetical protein GCM10019059_27240 [Camelimonas fluminis]